MTNQEIVEKVNSFLIDRLEMETELVKPESNLKADLGLTSLDMQELKIYCKRTFGFMPERQDMFRLNILADVYTYIASKI